MPISRLRKKAKKNKGPTPKRQGMNIREMSRTLDILEEAEREYYAKQDNDEENKDGSE